MTYFFPGKIHKGLSLSPVEGCAWKIAWDPAWQIIEFWILMLDDPETPQQNSERTGLSFLLVYGGYRKLSNFQGADIGSSSNWDTSMGSRISYMPLTFWPAMIRPIKVLRGPDEIEATSLLYMPWLNSASKSSEPPKKNDRTSVSDNSINSSQNLLLVFIITVENLQNAIGSSWCSFPFALHSFTRNRRFGWTLYFLDWYPIWSWHRLFDWRPQ